MTIRRFLLTIILLSMAGPASADGRPAFGFQSENDLYGDGGDRWYTNGFRMSYGFGDQAPAALETVLAALLPGGGKSDESDIHIAIGQLIFSPANLTRPTLIEEDRPFAGLLFGEAGISASSGLMRQSLTVSFGVTGDPSLARPAQKLVHDLTNTPEPRGWDNQLAFEPTVQLYYSGAWFLPLTRADDSVGIDIVPRLGADIGTVFLAASGGMMLRVGNALPRSLPPRIHAGGGAGDSPDAPSSDDFGWYLFGGIEGRAVAHNLFLDGGLFRDGHSVAKQTLLYEASAGVALRYGNYTLSYSFIRRSREFDLQPEGQSFGAITLTTAF